MKPNKTWIVGLVALAIGGCSNNGVLSLQLTDAPPETANMSTAIVTLAAAEAHFAGGDDDENDGALKGDDKDENGGWVRVSGAPKPYDLLRLQNGLTELVGELALPPGKITQIRLFIAEEGTNAVTLKDGTVCPLDLKDVDKKGIKISHPFKALPIKDGRTLEVVLDFDLKESIDQAAPCVYRLKPVIKIKTVKE